MQLTRYYPLDMNFFHGYKHFGVVRSGKQKNSYYTTKYYYYQFFIIIIVVLRYKKNDYHISRFRYPGKKSIEFFNYSLEFEVCIFLTTFVSGTGTERTYYLSFLYLLQYFF